MRFVFYPAIAGKPWAGDALEKGSLGGSESAIVYMARELARLGHEVLVFSTGKPGEYDDVVYLPFASARSILLTLPCDVLVCARNGTPITWPTRAQAKVLWCHDLPQGALPEAFDLYFMVSQWQAQVYAQSGACKPEKIRITPNGVDLSLFPKFEDDERFYHDFDGDDSPSLVWTSNPERGLWNAGRILQQVRLAYPKATLSVYGRNDIYGWDMAGEHVYYPAPAHRDGVRLTSSLSKQSLAKALSEYDVYIYPTWWPETFCIATLEAQAAAIPVVASAYGALTETVKGGLLIGGLPGVGTDAERDDYDERFAQAVIDLLHDGAMRQALGKQGRAYAETLGWDAAAKAWSGMFSEAFGLTKAAV